MSIKVLLADDHKIVREGLRALLEKETLIQVVGEADNGRAAVQLVEDLLPDVVIMDVSMPDLNGIEAAHQIKNKAPSTKVIGLSVHSDRRLVADMFRAGASGYLLKDCAFDELYTSIRAVMDNRVYISPSVAAIVIQDYVNRIEEDVQRGSPELTSREKEVLQLIAEGKSTKEIALKLNVSVKTVETHRQQIMRKTGTHSIAGLTKYALRQGLTSA
jgi:DNA-binding NarL/FixJ family response regulator